MLPQPAQSRLQAHRWTPLPLLTRSLLPPCPCALALCACCVPAAVVPVLMQGMMELNRKRPADPIDFLCSYLQQHNPRKQKTN